MRSAEQFAEQATADLRATYEAMIERAFAAASAANSPGDAVSGRQARNRRYYEKRKASEIKTPERLNPSESVLEANAEIKTERRLKASENVLNSDAPRACGLDNPLRLVDYHTVPDLIASAPEQMPELLAPDGWPEADPGEHLTATWTKRLMAVCGPRMGDPAKDGRLAMSSSVMAQWRKAGCSWVEDVIPTVRALSNSPGTQIKTWRFYDNAILEQASRRKSELVIPEASANVRRQKPQTAGPDPRTAARLERFEAYEDASRAALRQNTG